MLEEHLVDLVVLAMERFEKMVTGHTSEQSEEHTEVQNEGQSDGQTENDMAVSHLLWQHLSSQVIFFVLFQFASFPHMVLALYKKVWENV